MSNEISNVWIIEDHERYRTMLAGLIHRQEELTCPQQFDSCEAALATGDKGSSPDVILLDLGLPGMGGLKGIPELLLNYPKTVIIVLTVFDDRDRVFEAILNGAAGYLLKSSNSQAIIEAITDVLAGGSPLTPKVARHVLAAFSAMKHRPKESLLSEREHEILRLLADGMRCKQVGQKLNISYHTVDFHVRKIYNKLQVGNLSGAVSEACKKGLL